jgi:2-dehydropantoate 2-reductase
VRIDQDANFNTALWIKVLSNIAANTLTALTLQRNVVLKRPDLLELSREIMLETARVAQAEGAAIKEADIEPFLRAYAGQEDGSPAMTSMVQDRLAGRRTEFDFINGEVVRRAAKHSIDVPINRTMYALLAAIDANAGKGAA